MEDESEETDLDLSDDLNQDTNSTGKLGPLDKTGEIEIDGEKTQDLDLNLSDDGTDQFNLSSTDIMDGDENDQSNKKVKGITNKFPFLQKLRGVQLGLGKKKTTEEKVATEPESNEDYTPSEKSKVELFIDKNVPSLAPLAAKVSALGAKKKTSSMAEKELEENEEQSGKPDKPKRKIKVIHIIIILGAAFILLMDDFTTEESVPPKLKPKYKKEIKKNEPAPEVKPAQPSEPAPESDVTPEPEPEATPEPAPEPDATLEPAPEPDATPEPAPEPDATPEPAPDTATPSSSESDLDALFEEEKISESEPEEGSESDPEEGSESDPEEGSESEPEEVSESEPEEISESEPEEVNVEEADESDEGEIDPPPAVVVEPAPSESSDVELNKSPSDELHVGQQIIDKVAEPGGGEEITEAILKQLESNAKERRDQTINVENAEPTVAPTYLDSGAGLVYNCKGRHWACVSEPSFQQCGQNYAWHLKEGTSIECYPSEVYESPMDCAGMQQYKIDMAVETEFCSR